MSEVAHSVEAFQTVIEEHLLADKWVVVGGDVLERLLPVTDVHLTLLQVSQR